jgi:hypothetical protein
MAEAEHSEFDPLNRKAYIRGWESKDAPEDHEVSYWFCEFAKDAATWENLHLAQDAQSILNIGVRIPSIQGAIHSLRNFTVEPLSDKFVISCSGPFIYIARGSSNQDVGK